MKVEGQLAAVTVWQELARICRISLRVLSVVAVILCAVFGKEGFKHLNPWAYIYAAVYMICTAYLVNYVVFTHQVRLPFKIAAVFFQLLAFMMIIILIVQKQMAH
ncbi:MAG: hypothetical protein Q7Q73_08900 [Verrucomicrobiota bacterium JB024]|nr:hypothetical protein [Verrucomicrobiota bacterium JB024]